MNDEQAVIGTPMRRTLMIAIALTALICAFDTWGPLAGTAAVLYPAVILLMAPFGRRLVLAAGAITAALTLLSFVFLQFVLLHRDAATASAGVPLGLSLMLIVSVTALSLRDRFIRTTLREQARILELTHDTVIIRDPHDVILYWNDGAQQLYGWTREEAVGRVCSDLLHCAFPSAEVRSTLDTRGQWSGEIVRTRRDGSRIVLASRWLARRDPGGRAIGVIESSADLTELRRADLERRASERRYRTIFDLAGFAAWESDWSASLRVVREQAPVDAPLDTWLMAHPDVVERAIAGAVVRNGNQAAVDLFETGSVERLVGSNPCRAHPPEGHGGFARILAALAGGAAMAESETRLITPSGRIADVVLRVSLLPEGDQGSHVLLMAFDVTERNEARARIEAASAELAHAARVSMLGQLSASIAHEVNQPLTAIINYARSGQRWLDRPEPDFEEIRHCLDKITVSGTRAAEVIGRVRSLARKAPPQATLLDLTELADDAIELVGRELRHADITLRRDWSGELPKVCADRVQVQQVLVNLMMNSIQAMRDPGSSKRELRIGAAQQPDGMVQLRVQDTGPGFPDDASHVFEPFFTTKADGMGMGLSICRSIIEAQGGRVSAANNPHGPGAEVMFTLPAACAEPLASV
ncbi:ATP-binding protein [Burkholderia gladioli]|uniref:ATP-binding protein n=1 Tax=Burkholderia gladioli TaxID=28095 RepID=UPI001ABB6058|nr:ATP-binding protein [Burkholderia gladioli]